MAVGHSAGLVEFLRGLFPGSLAGELKDRELLLQFQHGTKAQAEDAFAVLVRRHGALVQRLCRHVLGDVHDAQDAFQATFLVLARKASSIRQTESLAAWLFGVSRRVAAQARLNLARRRAAEERGAAMIARHPVTNGSPELWTELYEEVARLPEKCRQPIILCYLEGLSHAEAARQLGWPLGTLKVRLMRGRESLRRRLIRCGLAPAVALLGVETCGTPSALATSTARAAVAFAAGRSATGMSSAAAAGLAEAVLQALGPSKIKTTVALVLFLALLAVSAQALGSKKRGEAEPSSPSIPFETTEINDPKESSVRIRVLRADEPTDKVYLTLWHAVDPAHKPEDRGILYEPFLWRDAGTGQTWERDRNWSPHYPKPEPFGFVGLPAGTYRITAMTYDTSPVPDPTPAGASDVFRLDGRNQQEITIRLDGGGASLTVRVLDADGGKPLERAALRLLRTATWTPREVKPDSLPIVHGHGSGNFFERTSPQGEVKYQHLVLGSYAVEALGRRASTYGELDYEPLSEPVQVQVVPWEIHRTLEIRVRGKQLPVEEVDRRWPFVVNGTVTDITGKPMPGVDVTVHSGIGTLFQTGHAVTGAEGKYTLRFRPGMAMAGGRLGGQAATIKAQRSGFFERNLSRQGNLITADQPLHEQERANYRAYAGILVPRTAYRLDFVMLPATTIEGKLVDGQGQPVPGRKIWISGKELPPSQSVVASLQSDDRGNFRVEGVPQKDFHFSTPGVGRGEVQTEAVRFAKPGTYKVELTFESSPVPQLRVRVVTRP